MKRIYAEKIAESEKKSLDLLETEEQKKEKIKNMNWDIVVPKADSKLYKQIKKSETLQKWVADNYENIKNNEFADQKTSIGFPWQRGDTLEKLDLYTTVNRADLHNTRINQDGSLTTLLNDIYDFEVMDKRKDENSGKEARSLYNAIVDLNNAAYKKQQRNEIKKYVLSLPLRYSREGLEEILKKYKIR